jgi:maltooligosyltrehalose trehalohydrolase
VTKKPAETIGAVYLGERTCRFRVWAPEHERVGVRLLKNDRLISMARTSCGYHEAIVQEAQPGDLYFFQLEDGNQRGDPASRLQPQGVHGPSAIVNPEFAWADQDWRGIALKDYIIYELHVGSFTAAGTFAALTSYLDYFSELGVTAIELMPIAQFPGARNWGYDGVYPFAAQNSYGGPADLKMLIDACHRRGFAVILDVVYNHLGPEGNYFPEFGPYFTDRYQTPWGSALNFDGPWSDEVRNYFIQNALYWVVDCHIDALRLDAVHAILDHSPFSFLEDLADEVHRAANRLNREIFLIAESADNDRRLVRAPERGGYGLDAQWNDDFHHCLRTLLTGERSGYYRDYGDFTQFVKAYREGFAYSGEYSKFRRRRHGSSSRDLGADRFVVFAQNHDQVGNRMCGDRLSAAVSFEDLKLAAGIVLLSPYLPLLFMGEEYAESAPFPYFISHSDAALIDAVRRGRQSEFASFDWQGEIPDPQSEATFLSAKLHPELRTSGAHAILWAFYKELIALRKKNAALARLAKESMDVVGYENEKVLLVRRRGAANHVVFAANLSADDATIALPFTDGCWRKLIDSAAPTWRGAGALPDQLDGGTEHRLTFASRSFAVFDCALSTRGPE